MYTMGALMLVLFFLRFAAFHLYESPKYLMGRGRDAEAVEVVHKVAAYNGKTSSLTLQMLQDAESVVTDEEKGEKAVMDTSVKAAISRKLRSFSGDHVRTLFATRKLAYSTSLLIILWGKSKFHS